MTTGPNKADKSIKLRVAEARSRDVGRKIARVDRETMKKLGIEVGDFVEVIGPKGREVVKIWPAYSEDEGQGLIRVDGTVRKSIGVSPGDYVTIRPIKVDPATRIVVAPAENMPRINADPDYFAQIIKKYLQGNPVKRGDVLDIPFYGMLLRFIITSVQPSAVVYVTDDTNIEVRLQPLRPGVVGEGVPLVTWEDIGDLEEVKQRIREIVELPLKHPELFERLGIEPPKGILLFGPPGTGKTLLAKAVATESGANFIAIRGPEVLSKWVGESEKAIRQIFRRARMVAPTVVFFDEIDSIAGVRGSDPSGVIDRIVNQLLTELDGIQPLRRVVVIAATNRPDLLDPALLRPGRFDKLVYVPPPDQKARLEIFKVHTRKLPLAEDVNLEELSRRTEGYTGADIAAVCKEAAMLALREVFTKSGSLQVTRIELRHFAEALNRIPPSLSKTDVEMYDRLAKELKRVSTSGGFRRIQLPYA